MTFRRYSTSYSVLTASVVVVFLSAISGGGLSFATEPNRSDATSASEEAARLYKRGDLDGAVKVLQRIVATDPTNAQLHFMLANGLFRQKDWPAAIEHYEDAVRLRDHHPDSYLGLGYAYFQAARIDDAVKAWRTAVRQIPDEAFANLSLCVGLLRQGQTVSAQRYLIRAIQLEPEWRHRVAIDVRWNPEMVRELESFANHSILPGTKQASVRQEDAHQNGAAVAATPKKPPDLPQQ
jgi:tetratricopeptide (TPR) repeat protein